MNKNKKDGADSVIGSWPKAQGSDPAQVSKPSKIDEPYESIQGPKEVAPSAPSKKDSAKLLSPKILRGPAEEIAPSAPSPSPSTSNILEGLTKEVEEIAPSAPSLSTSIKLQGLTNEVEKIAPSAPSPSKKDSELQRLTKEVEEIAPSAPSPSPSKKDSELQRLTKEVAPSTEDIAPSAPSKKDSAKLQSPKILHGPDELSFYSDLPQRSAKDSLPKTPESSSPMTNTPKIGEAQDVFPFQRMNVSEISQLLELPKNLHSLKIEGCDVLDNIPERVMASIPSLQRLYIINCCSLKSFPEPADLRILHIQNCKKLEFPPPAGKTNQYAFLEHLCIGNSCDSLTFLPLDLFPKLRCLSIWDCQNLISLSIQEGNQKDLTSLEALEIRDCPDLVNFPEGGLPTPNLTSIWLSNCNLKELPLQLRTTLTSLRSIFINKCPELVSLFKGDSASNLSLLSITSCDKLMPMREWGLHMLKCLIKLEIEGGCEDLESFPEEKLLPGKLKSLRVSRLLNLKSLDYKGLQHLTALKTLEISCCAKLESLPEEGLPSSLSVLCIKECSLLKPKLQKQTGDYWPKIARISFIETDEEVISRKSPRSKQ